MSAAMALIPASGFNLLVNEYNTEDCSGPRAGGITWTFTDGSCSAAAGGSLFTICNEDLKTYNVYNFTGCSDCTCAWTLHKNKPVGCVRAGSSSSSYNCTTAS